MRPRPAQPREAFSFQAPIAAASIHFHTWSMRSSSLAPAADASCRTISKISGTTAPSRPKPWANRNRPRISARHEPVVLILDALEAGMLVRGDHSPCYVVIDHDSAGAVSALLLKAVSLRPP